MKQFLFILGFSILCFSSIAQGNLIIKNYDPSKEDTLAIVKPWIIKTKSDYYCVDSTGQITRLFEKDKFKLVLSQQEVEALWKSLDNSNENHVMIRQLQQFIADQINRQRK